MLNTAAEDGKSSSGWFNAPFKDGAMNDPSIFRFD